MSHDATNCIASPLFLEMMVLRGGGSTTTASIRYILVRISSRYLVSSDVTVVSTKSQSRDNASLSACTTIHVLLCSCQFSPRGAVVARVSAVVSYISHFTILPDNHGSRWSGWTLDDAATSTLSIQGLMLCPSHPWQS